jgi:DNA adenine methylase
VKIKVPPIKCQGIKTKLVPWILSNVYLPENGVWIEPFMGSGVVGFNAYPKQAIFGDLNPHIINFYQALQRDDITPPIVREYLREEGEKLKKSGGAYYYEVRERFNKDHHPLDFLFLSRSSFNGMMRFNSKGGFNVPFCKKPERFSKAYITKIVNQVAHVWRMLKSFDWEFRHASFERLIEDAGEQDFIYCDPPYFGRHVDYFNSWGKEQEEKLAHLLHRTPAKFMLSTWHSNKYRENPSISEYWQDFYLLTKEHFYHVGAMEKNRNAMLEALAMNYPPPTPKVERMAMQLALFEQRARYVTTS